MKQTISRIYILVLCLIFASSCKNSKEESMSLTPPVAPKHPTKLEKHGDVRIDDYYWMNNREDQQVLDYLNAENEYYQKMTAHTAEFQEELYKEMKSRIKEDDSSVPYKLNGYWYISRYEEGKEYPIYSRKKENLEAKEELMFDCNLMAKDHEFFNLRGVSVSPDNTLASFATDTISRRQYNIQIKNLQTGEIYPDIIENTTGSSVWANDGKTLFYTKKDPVTLRSDKIYKHILGTPSTDDKLVFEETDDTYNTFVYKTKSKKFIVIGSASTLTTEYRFLNADDPEGEFTIFSLRDKGVEYSISHYDGNFYVLTNKDNATNFKLMKTDEQHTSSENWKEFIPHREDVLLEDIEIFKDYYVLSERENGLNQMKISKWDDSDSYYLPFDSETYVAGPTTNLDFDTKELRYFYNEMGAPYAIIDFNMETKTKNVLKEQEVLGGKFDKANYKTERLWATAGDGTRVPISL